MLREGQILGQLKYYHCLIGTVIYHLNAETVSCKVFINQINNLELKDETKLKLSKIVYS